MSDIEKKETFQVDIESTAGSRENSVENNAAATSDPIWPNPDKSGWQNFVDSFKRAPEVEIDPSLTPAQRAAFITSTTPLKRKLQNRHIQMIGFGGAIGTGLFIGAGESLSESGPAGLLIGYLISASFVLCIVCAVGEMAVEFPISGGFTTYATRFIDESYGFASNWNYVMGGMVSLPLELVSASITVTYWGTPTKYTDAFVALFYILTIFINFFGVKGYGEAEFYFTIVKVLCVIGFIFLGLVLVCGGGPNGHYEGGTYWHAPYGAFVGDNSVQRFKSTISVFVSAAFAYSGVESVGLTAAETKNPRKALPKAAKQVFWRIVVFYIVSLTLVGLLVSHKDPRLIGNSTGVDTASSPFVIAIENHGIKGLPSVFNVVILISVLSVGNATIFAVSRIMLGLAQAGHMPKWMHMDYVDRKGRPLVPLITISTFGLLAFIAASNKQVDVFDWMFSLSGLSILFTWFGISLCHIRFRKALAAQGRSTDELIFKSPTGVWGSYYSCFCIGIVVICTVWIDSTPYGYIEMSASAYASNWFQNLMSIPVYLIFYLGSKIYRNNWKIFIPPKEVDIDTGRNDADRQELLRIVAIEKEEMAKKSFWIRTYHAWC